MQQQTCKSSDEAIPPVIVGPPDERIGCDMLPAHQMWQIFFVFVADKLE
jgi:hypothetical protein